MAAERPSKMADIPILKCRNPWHNGFLENYVIMFYDILNPQQQANVWYVYKIKC